MQAKNSNDDRTEVLADLIFRDVSSALKIPDQRLLTQVIKRITRSPAKKFAQALQALNETAAESTVWEAATGALQHFADGCRVFGGQSIPHEGPLLVVANHPGSADSLGVVAALKRPDINILAGHLRMMEGLPEVTRHLIFLTKNATNRMGAMREAIARLQNGESVLVFPRGFLEPDPAILPGALESLNQWTESVGVFLHKVPETVLQPMLISHVVSPKAWNGLPASLAKTSKRRHQIAMIWQFARQATGKSDGWRIPMRIFAGQPVSAKELSPALDVRELNQAVRERMKALLLSVYPDPDQPGLLNPAIPQS